MFIIKTFHRADTSFRKHYSVSKGLLKFRPRLLYAGHSIKRHPWREDIHSHNFCEILFITGGYGTANVEGNLRHIKKGDIIIYNPHCRHAEESSALSPLEFFFCAFDDFTLSDLAPCALTNGAFFLLRCKEDMYNLFYSRFNALITEQADRFLFHSELSQTVSHEILLYILRYIADDKEVKKDLYEHHILKRAVSYLEENFAQSISLEKVSAECYVSKYYLAHLFKTHKGVTIGEYVRSLRLNEAKKLLRTTSKPVNDIAFRCGFHDVSYFHRVFKAQTGVTPSVYRKKEELMEHAVKDSNF